MCAAVWVSGYGGGYGQICCGCVSVLTVSIRVGVCVCTLNACKYICAWCDVGVCVTGLVAGLLDTVGCRS